MIGWRLVKTRYVDSALSAADAARDGGCWNPIGTPIVYCACTLSLAALEVLVHIRAGMQTARFHAVKVEVPDGSIEALDAGALPDSWRGIPCDPATQAIGRAWAVGLRSVAFRVPSVIVPQESNLLLNPSHAAFAHVRVMATFPFAFDPRLSPQSGSPRSGTAPR